MNKGSVKLYSLVFKYSVMAFFADVLIGKSLNLPVLISLICILSFTLVFLLITSLTVNSNKSDILRPEFIPTTNNQ